MTFSSAIKRSVEKSPFFCAVPEAESEMQRLLNAFKKSGNSIGGRVHTTTSPLPKGLGDPVYNKLEAELAYAMLSIPASKGFTIGHYSEQTTGKEGNDAPCSNSKTSF